MKILVIGATGNIGSFLVEELKLYGADFTALVRNEKKGLELENRGIKTAIADLYDDLSIKKAIAGFNKVFLVTPAFSEQDQVQKMVIDAALDAGVKHLVKVSAYGADALREVDIMEKHARTDEYALNTGMDVTILRPHVFMQNLFGMAGTIKGMGMIFMSMGEGRVPMVDSRDIAGVAAKVLTEEGHSGKIYSITGPEQTSYHDVAAAFSAILGREIKYQPVSFEEGQLAMISAGMPEWLAVNLTGLNKAFSSGNQVEATPDVEKILGRKGRTLIDFVSGHKEFFT